MIKRSVSDNNVIKIRNLFRELKRQSELSIIFNVSNKVIRGIVFGKTYNDIPGAITQNELEIIRSKQIPWNKGKKYTNTHRKNIGKFHKGKIISDNQKEKLRAINTGKKLSLETKKKIGEASIGRTHSKESRLKIGISSKNRIVSQETKDKISFAANKRNLTDETRRKMRESAINRVSRQKFQGMPVMPSIGKNENHILDAIELEYGIKLIRQYKINGYFLDGYDKVNNIAYEVDEKYHEKNIKNDNYRQNIIECSLGCTFIRIEDKD